MDQSCQAVQVSLCLYFLFNTHNVILREELESDGPMNLLNQYDVTFFTAAGYDGPMNIWNRRNEVMFHKRS